MPGEEQEEEEPNVTVSVGGVPLEPVPRQERITRWEGTRYRVMNINQIMEPVELAVGVLEPGGVGDLHYLAPGDHGGHHQHFQDDSPGAYPGDRHHAGLWHAQSQVQQIFLWEAVLLGLVAAPRGWLYPD